MTVNLFGVLRTAARAEKICLTLEDGATVRTLLDDLVSKVNRDEFQTIILDPELKDPRPNALVLVCGIEIGTLQGLETTLKDGDAVTFLPVAHGG